MTSLYLCLLMVGIASAIDTNQQEEWESFKVQHNKQYTSVEEQKRMKIFIQNSQIIADHNELYEKDVESYSLGMNEFGDLTDSEFLKMTMQGFNFTEATVDDEAATFIEPQWAYYPTYVDWRKAGAVTRVKSQGLCGACWAFSATGALEGQYFRKTRRLVSLSEQNLIDCSNSYGNEGCGGGWPKNAFLYIQKNKGIDTEKSYPYKAYNGKCRYNPKYSSATDNGFMKIPKSEYKLKKAVATKGPVSVTIDASHKTIRFYKRGIFYYKYCKKNYGNLNHALLVVGYGTRGGDYWLLKNSWGRDWGQGGYMKLARNRNNHCGIATAATIPIV